MIRDDQNDPSQDDPESALRRRITTQIGGGDVGGGVSSPVYGEPPATPPPPANTPAAPPVPFDREPGRWDRSPDSFDQYPGGGAPKQGITDPPWTPPATVDAPPAPPAPPPVAPPAAPPQAGPDAPPSAGRPTGGALTDPGFAARYVAWAGTQPGVNPSVKTDPGYWIGRFTSGAFKNDQEYALTRMMQAEGPPEGSQPNTAPRGSSPGAPMASPFGAQATAAAPSAPLGSSGFSSLSGGTANGPQGVWNSEFVTRLRQMLMSRLSAASTPVDPNAPEITAPLTAARDEATRGTDRERTQLAEQLYASGGLNTDAISQKIQQSGEQNALGLGSLRATLITRELSQKRDELRSLLQMAMQSGDVESAQAIQLQMSALQAQLQREGMNLDAGKYQAYLNQNAVLAGLNG